MNGKTEYKLVSGDAETFQSRCDNLTEDNDGWVMVSSMCMCNTETGIQYSVMFMRVLN